MPGTARRCWTSARDRGSPIAAIVNTHWHLDHVSGNPALRARYPRLRVHASNAIDEALGGFLAQSARDAQGYLDDPQLPETLRADIRADRDTIANGAALRPDVVIDRSARRRIAGRLLEVHLAANAATGGDVWLRDPASGVVVLGDLVTLPAPFLDTACPEGWRAALASIAATRFTVAIPGHGGPLGPAQFAQYRAAFDAFIGCAASARGRDACATEWAASVRGLLEAPDTEFERARSMSAYYVDLLRAGGGRSRYCEAPK
ncbi:MAG: MBL fold metallo-hydrolase [Steroidobacteraceae bacterium]